MEFIIYGAGIIGKELYKKIKDIASVHCFVDGNKAGGEFENVKIITADMIQYTDGIKVIVTATYDYDNIKNGLLDRFREEDIISLDEILKLDY